MSEKRNFLKASSHYLTSQVAVLGISLISFPIVVRLLSIEEYGILSLCNTILLFAVALSKLGLQKSIIRFYPDYENTGELPCFFRSYAVIGLILGFIFFWISGLMTYVFVPTVSSGIIWLVAGVTLFQTIFSYLTNFLRSQERSSLFSLISVLNRLFTSFGGIGLIFLFHDGILNLFQAQVFSQVVVVIFLIVCLGRYFKGGGKFISVSLLVESIKFGLPLVAFEMSSIALAFSDRFLITYFNGVEQLGIYAVAYTLCMYIGDLLRQPISMAVGPMYTRIYAQEGEGQAADFLAELGRLVALIGLPIFFGCVAIRTDLITFLASAKYLSAAPVIPWVLGGFLLYACQPIISAGLYLKKKTATIAIISFVCFVLNIIANFLLLPHFGMIAAAWTTAGSYTLAVILIYKFSAKQLLIKWPFVSILKYTASAFLMFLVVANLSESLNLFVKILVGLLLYPMIVLIIDGYVRQHVKNFIMRRFA